MDTKYNKDLTDVFLALLRQGLWEGVESINLSGFDEWKQLMKIASEQTLIGVVADGIGKSRAAHLMPAEIKRQVMMRVMDIERSHVLLNGVLAEVMDKLTAARIGCTLLKGQGVAEYYPVPRHRQCGDIDLYIGRENYDRASELAGEAFTIAEGEEDHTSETEKHLHFEYKGVSIEFHRVAAVMLNARHTASFDAWTHEQLTQSACSYRLASGHEVKTPSATYEAFFLFYHLYYHYLHGGIGLRQLCDWARMLYVRHDDIDVEQLALHLRQYNLLTPWQQIGEILVGHLGLKAEYFPLYAADGRYAAGAAKILECIFAEGNFGHRGALQRHLSKQHKSNISRKIGSYLCHTQRFVRLISRCQSQEMRQHLLYAFIYTTTQGFKFLGKERR